MGYPLREMMETLAGLTEEQWGGYAFYHEPLERKFDRAQRAEYIKKANACGREEAAHFHADPSVRALAESMGFRVTFTDVPTGGGRVLFAQYVEPDEITVYADCIKRAEKWIRQEHLSDILPAFDLGELLLAHELFHGIEYRNKKTIYTQTERIELWKKPFSNRSRILCLSEIAAMAFAQALTGSGCSPYVLDVLLMYDYNPEAAAALYEEILEAAGIREREEEEDAYRNDSRRRKIRLPWRKVPAGVSVPAGDQL